VNYAASHGGPFGGLEFSISLTLSKRWCKTTVFGRKITVFSKPLAEFWRYRKSETTKRCAMQSCIIHVPSSEFSEQYWRTGSTDRLAKTGTELAGSGFSSTHNSWNVPKMDRLLTLAVYIVIHCGSSMFELKNHWNIWASIGCQLYSRWTYCLWLCGIHPGSARVYAMINR